MFRGHSNDTARRDEAVIRTKVEEMLEKLWKGRGGLIAGRYSDDASIGLDPYWQEFACEVFLEKGIRPRYATRMVVDPPGLE